MRIEYRKHRGIPTRPGPVRLHVRSTLGVRVDVLTRVRMEKDSC